MKKLCILSFTLSLMFSGQLYAGVKGEGDGSYPYGTWPKHFVVGQSRPNSSINTTEMISSNYVSGVIRSWENPEWDTTLITHNMGCVFGDEDFEYDPVNHRSCPDWIEGGIGTPNEVNEIYFNAWSGDPDWANWLGVTIPRNNPTFEYDIFINENKKWNTINELQECVQKASNDETFWTYLIDSTLLHELGHAIGLGHELDPLAANVLMAPARNMRCIPNQRLSLDLIDVDYYQVEAMKAGRVNYDGLVTKYEWNTLKKLYFNLGENKPITIDLDISSPENNENLNFGQSYTFTAADMGPTTYSNEAISPTVNGLLANTQSVSGLTWKWESDIDGVIGNSQSITLDDLSPGWHIITVTATDGRSGSTGKNGEAVVSVKVVSNGLYGSDSTNLFPNPCVRYVGNPDKGCLLYFTGEIQYPSDGSCNLFYTPSFTAENLDTGKTFTTKKFFGTSNCSTNNRSDSFSWYFWLEDPDEKALVRGTYKVTAPGCSTFSDVCFTSTYHALIPIVSASITFDPIATSCELPGNATHCSVDISWSNGKYNYDAGLFYREDAQSPWIFLEYTNRSQGKFSIPDIVDEDGIQLAIFQFTKNTFGKPFTSPAKGRMTPIKTVIGNRVAVPAFMGEEVFSFGGTSEDVDIDSWGVLDNGATLNLFGNTWKAIDYNYEVNMHTWLEFEYRSDGPDSPEVAGISLLTTSSGTTNVKSENAFQVDGIHRFGNQWFNRYFSNGWKKYDINVGHVMKYWSTSERSVRQLGFIGDIDQNGKQIDISYRNPRLYQKSTNQLPEWGHSGNWYGKDTNGQGFALEVNPINGMVIALWYTYAEDGHDKGASYNRTYLQSGAYGPTDREVPLTMYQTTGGRFNRSNTTTNKIVGTAKMRFFDCYNAHIEYDFSSGYNSGRRGYIPLTRITRNVDCKGADRYMGANKSEFGYTGNWYNPATNGQGFTFEVNPAQNVIVGQWFTYKPDNYDLQNPNRQRVFTVAGSYTPGSPHSEDMIIYQTTGGALDDPNAVTTEAVGTASVEFHSCTSATIDYDFTGTQDFNGLYGSINLVRITSNVTCE